MASIKDYIIKVLRESPEDTDFDFEIGLDHYGDVCDENTGNTIRFCVFNGEDLREEMDKK